MKKIRKSHAPRELQQWLIDNSGLNNSYGDLCGTDAHSKLKEVLLCEQGFLCGYSGKQISDDTSHLEHIKPQSRCVNGEDVDYRNLIACFPEPSYAKEPTFGAVKKGGWWPCEIEDGNCDRGDLFISPLDDDCERRFSFSWKGKVKPAREDDEAATTTIEKLGLDDKELSKLRLARINGFFGFSRRTPPLSKREAQQLLRNIDKPNSKGKLTEYCFVIKQLLPKYIAGGQ